MESSNQEEFIEIEKGPLSQKMKISYRNTDMIKVKYFKTDMEVLFSKNPFMSTDDKNFSFVNAYLQEDCKVTKKRDAQLLEVSVPEALKNNNLYIQISAGSCNKTISHFPTNLTLRIQENYGIVKVINTKTGQPLSKIYVKCFSEDKSRKTNFYKDGYTDIRGCFDYVKLNTDK